MSHLHLLAQADTLVVRQAKEMLEIFTAFEGANRYAVELPDGRPLLYVVEAGEGAKSMLARTVFKGHREFTLQLLDPNGNEAFVLERPWTWFFSEIHMRDGDGNVLGMIDQRWEPFSRRFAVLDARNVELAELHGPLLRPWTFRVMQGEEEVGRISKRWGGLLEETFTNADTFTLQLGSIMDPRLRALVLAATFLVDFVYFEDR